MSFEISELAQTFAPWSISKSELAETCPKQFEYKYIMKAPEDVVPSANRVGTAAHRVLELRLGGMSAKDAKKQALEEHPLTDTEGDDLRALEDAIDAFLKKFEKFCAANGVVKLLLEQKWGVDANGEACDFFDKEKVFFRGVIDLGVITASNDLIVIDHKSGVAKDIDKNQKFKRQLNSYAVMGLAHVKDLAGARGAINFLQGPEDKRIQWLDYVSADRISTVIRPWLFAYISFCAESLKKVPYVAKPKAKWPCSYCSFRPSCSAYQEMLRGAEI